MPQPGNRRAANSLTGSLAFDQQLPLAIGLQKSQAVHAHLVARLPHELADFVGHEARHVFRPAELRQPSDRPRARASGGTGSLRSVARVTWPKQAIHESPIRAGGVLGAVGQGRDRQVARVIDDRAH